MSAPVTRRRPQGGPPPLAPALAYGALLIASVAVWIGGPQPGTSAASTLSYAQAHTGQLHAEAVLVFGAAVPLAIWAATIYRRLRTLGVTAPGAVIGLAGGILAAASLALSGLVTWVAADTAHIAGPGLAKALFDLSFAAGAAGFVVPFALLIAGVAVPSLILRLTPRPLAIWAATIYRRLRTLGVTAPGAVIGLAGGILAAASLALSGLVTWVTADTAHIAGPALAKALSDLSFAAGAAGFVVPFALLIAGVAVPSLILRLTPGPLAWGGLVVAATGMLSTLTLLTSALDVTLPIARFGGRIFIVAVSALLPATRHRLTAAVPVAA